MKKNKAKLQQIIMVLLSLLFGAATGILIVVYEDKAWGGDRPSYTILLMLLEMYIAMFLQVIIHEAGHLVFGLMTGYRFSSFRIGSFAWTDEDGKVSLKRISITGTSGQCLMSPPDIVDGHFPYVMYNLGGVFMNLLSAAVFLGIGLLLRGVPFVSSFFTIMAAIGVIYAVLNGVPLRNGLVSNDGCNAAELRKNKDARKSFWVQLKVNDKIAKGMRLKDMPEEWFEIPSDEGMKNGMTSVIGVFACNRLMDQKHFQEADALMDRLLNMDTAIVNLHRNLLICDRIYCELIGENRREKLDELMTKQQRRFMKNMRKYPSVLRTEYAYAVLADKNSYDARAIRAQFDEMAKKYPYPSDIESERELMDIADGIVF